VSRRLTRPLAALLALGACTFFDPLDQAGLGIILSPADTAVLVGGRFSEHGMMVNSYGDVYPSDHLHYIGLDPDIAVTGGGTVTGVAYGRATVVVTRGGLADTGRVSVVPAGTLALSKSSDTASVDVVNADGSGFTSVVSAGQFGGGAPAWLPGNAGLVYQYAILGGGGDTQLFVTDFAGHTTMLEPFGRNPRVARDGGWVYFQIAANEGEIWRVHVDGSGLEAVATDTLSGGDAQPDPSPDGTQLAFMSTRFPGGGFQLAVRDLATGAERLLGTEGQLPRWAPSGDSLAYWHGDVSSGMGAIFVIGANGGGARQVSPTGRIYRPLGLDWSPDGQWLLARSDSSLDLIRVNDGLVLPLGYAARYFLASWRW